MRALLALPLLVGCIGPEPWGRADVEVWGDARFERVVAQAVNEWDLALADRCGGPVFRLVDDGGRPIRLVDHIPAKCIGLFDGDTIDVLRGLSQADTRAVVVHELGHAIGLDHVPAIADPMSIMHPAVNGYLTSPSDGDVELAVSALGCE